MEKFWKWMKEKRYGGTEYDYIWLECIKSGGVSRGVVQVPTPQMLIGYMMEYLDSLYAEWVNELIVCLTTESRYNWLVSKINEIGGEK